jgi:hypothetical protein
MSTGKAISENHPDEVQLAAYLEAPQLNEFKEVRRHLIGCPACRKEVTALQTMVRGLQNASMATVENPPGDHPDEVSIADYVEKRLSDERRAEIKQHIFGCSDCMKATLHYAIESAEGEGSTKAAPVPVRSVLLKTPEKEAGPTEKSHGIFSWRMPVWLGVPATALATLLLVILLSPRSEKEALQVVAYQDKPEVVFTAPKGDVPGIGFFGGAREKSEPFEGLNVRPEDDQHLRLKWPEIKTARLYEVRLYSSNGEGRTLVGQASTTGGTEVLLQVSGMMPGRRYEWELSGTTTNNNNFIARGGLAVGVEVKF